MHLNEAIQMAGQILDEERINPTVNYVQAVKPGISGALVYTGLEWLRRQSPRQIIENTQLYKFESINYNLLCALLAQVNEKDQPTLITHITERIKSIPACGKLRTTMNMGPSWNKLISELPLVAEFCVRIGAKQVFFRSIGATEIVPGHVMMFQELEDMICLNFTVFTEAEYQQLNIAATSLQVKANSEKQKYRGPPVTGRRWQEIGEVNPLALYTEVLYRAHSIIELSRKARYLYLKGSLLEGFNFEVNQDKTAVESYLEHLGFNELLLRSLNEAERLYLEGGSGFTLKSSMGHLRSFMEDLQTESLPAVQMAKRGPSPPSGWGPGLRYLRQVGFVSEEEERFVASLYTLMSDEGVHPIIAEKEYARLARNMVIEYALLFLKRLEKIGVKIK